MIDRAEYPVAVQWTGEKRGVIGSVEGLPTLEVAAPPEFDGHAGIWSPEHLYVASVASCYMTTLLAIAGVWRVEIRSLEIPAVGVVERGEDRMYSIPSIVLRPRITLASEKDLPRAERLAEKAENVCMVSRSLKTEVTLEATFSVAEAVDAEQEPVHEPEQPPWPAAVAPIACSPR